MFDNLKIFLMYNKYVNTLHYLFISVYHGWMNFYKRITILFIYGEIKMNFKEFEVQMYMIKHTRFILCGLKLNFKLNKLS
jgi:hypothetical protein